MSDAPTAKQILASRILGIDLGAWIYRERHAGWSERDIERTLNARLRGVVTISRTTLRRWYPLPEETPHDRKAPHRSRNR